ncbi:MAG: DUF1844 domain-containing protein [Acidobacteriota bacterium]
MSESRFKVTDKRMFTADGQLREEFRFLEEEGSATAEEPAVAAAPESAEAPEPTAGGAPGGSGGFSPPADAGPAAPEAPAPESADVGEEGTGPAFLDLLAMMAEPASIYLQRAQAARGQDPESLQLAGLHIDLLDVLRRKTHGNLSAQESSALESALYQLRNAYIQIRGV